MSTTLDAPCPTDLCPDRDQPKTITGHRRDDAHPNHEVFELKCPACGEPFTVVDVVISPELPAGAPPFILSPVWSEKTTDQR